MPKKETSDRISTLAAHYLSLFGKYADGYFLLKKEIRDLRSICASVLAQDETKGKRTKRRAPPRKTKR